MNAHPLISPRVSLIGETVTITSTEAPSFVTCRLSKLMSCSPRSALPSMAFVSSAISWGSSTATDLPTTSCSEKP
jgi:hypothetical protein